MRRRLRLPLGAWFALLSLLLVAGLGKALVDAVERVVADQAVAEASRSAELVAGLVRHDLASDAFTRTLVASDRVSLDRTVREAPELRSLRLWGPAGLVVYDSDARLDGTVQQVGELLQGAYDGRTGAHLEYERDSESPSGRGELLEVYVAVRAAPDAPVVGAVELYLRYDAAAERADAASRTLTVLLLLGLGLLWALMCWLSTLVTRRLRRHAGEQAELARTDALTGLPNRRALLGALDEALAEQVPVALLLLDLDRFKDVNDTLGHATGDRLLQDVGVRLVEVVGATGSVARLGGDEFAVLLRGQDDPLAALAVADRLVLAFDRPFSQQDLQLTVQPSVGVALAPLHAVATGELLQRADVAMYVAKGRVEGTAVYDHGNDAHSLDRLALLGDLRTALAVGELALVYQPVYDLQLNGGCTSVEALVRWHSPRRGLVLPSAFVPLCEGSGLMRALTRFVLDEALRQCRTWQDHGTSLAVAVNLSASNLMEDDLPEAVAALLAHHGVGAERLILEVTESAVVTDPERAARVLHRLVGLGVNVALDDFGTGWSSMSRLLELPLAALKVDQSFVADLPDGQGAAVVQATTGLGHQLGLWVVAEGIETVEQLRHVMAIGCDVGQGYLMARPLPPEAVPAAARRNVSDFLGGPEHGLDRGRLSSHDTGSARIP